MQKINLGKIAFRSKHVEINGLADKLIPNQLPPSGQGPGLFQGSALTAAGGITAAQTLSHRAGGSVAQISAKLTSAQLTASAQMPDAAV